MSLTQEARSAGGAAEPLGTFRLTTEYLDSVPTHILAQEEKRNPAAVAAERLPNRRAVNAPLLAAIVFKSHADHAFVEGVGARPGEGPTGAFSFGRARGGVIEGVLAAAGVPVTFVSPPAWKRAVGLTLASKDASRRGNPPLARQCRSFRARKR